MEDSIGLPLVNGYLMVALGSSNGMTKLDCGRLTVGHKVLCSAKEIACKGRQDFYFGHDGGHLIPDLYRVTSSFFGIGLRLPSNTSLSGSFSRGELTASVFILHPNSLMMSGARLKSSSILFNDTR